MFKKFDVLLNKILEIITTVCMGAVIIISFLQVFFRYVLSKPLSWSQEAIMILFVYSILFGAALALKRSEHLQVNIFENMPEFLKKLIRVLEHIVVFMVIIALFYYGYILVQSNLQSGQTVGLIPIKKGYVYLAIPISALFMLYYQVRKVFR